MKKIGEYTARGVVQTDNAYHKIILDDGNFETGYKIVEFVVAPHDMDNANIRTYNGKLVTDDDQTAGINWNWDRNSEIAWSLFHMDANDQRAPNHFSQVDPDNLVIQDLYIVADEGSASANIKMNYFIRMEKYDITDSQGALAMVRNRSQA